MTNDQITVVLGAVRRDVPPVEGAMTIVAGCGHYAWMSSNAATLLTNNDDAVTKCDNCLEPHELLGLKVNAVPGAVEEAAQHLGISPEEVMANLTALAEQHGGEVAPYPKGMK